MKPVDGTRPYLRMSAARSPEKVSNKSLKQARGPGHPLFGVPTPSMVRRSRLRVKQESGKYSGGRLDYGSTLSSF